MIKKIVFLGLVVGSMFSTYAQTYKVLLEDANKELASGSKSNAAAIYNKAGYAAWDVKDYTSTILAFEKSLSINKELGNHNGVKVMYSNIGDAYLDQQKYTSAEKFFKEGQSYFKGRNDKAGEGNFTKKLGELSLDKKDFSTAIKYFEEALLLANRVNDENNIRNCHRQLSEAYKAKGDTEKSFEHFEIYRALLTKMQKEQHSQIQENAQQQVANVASEKAKIEEQKKILVQQSKSAQDSLLKTKESLQKTEAMALLQQEHIEKLEVEKQLNELQEENRLLIIEIFTLVFVFIVGFTIYVIIMLRRVRNKNSKLKIQQTEILKQHEEIEKKSNLLETAYGEIHEKSFKIESSINYAKRIQNSMLPSLDRAEKFFDDFFILFKPKDVVSGDFYWFDNVRTGLGEVRRDRNRLALTAVDCTGHGVPGAFMSLLGYNALQNINGAGINQSDLMLNELHSRIRYNILKQDKTNNKDGMDMSLCIVDKAKKEIQFSGAHNPLIYIQNDELFQIKGDRFPIGGVQREEERVFNIHTIETKVPTYAYLFSDGFQDQFGGPQGRKFMIKRMKQMFLDNHKKPFEEQKKIFESAFDQWVNHEGTEHKQIDDVLIIGFKVS